MVNFSKRYGYSNGQSFQLESMDDTLKTRIWNAFYGKEFNIYDTHDFRNCLTNVEKMMDKMGVVYEYPIDRIYKSKNANAFRIYLLNSDKWYLMCDFIEKYIDLIIKETYHNEMIIIFNKILEEEVSGYRIINGLITPIIGESEIQAIDEATKTKYNAVNIHIGKALSLFADRKTPDYENTIKESINAIESLCKIITEDDSATLSKALDKLSVCGIKLHRSFKTAIGALYGYTSDENGIRHAGIDFKGATSEDAKYMLVSCSAFVNYLIEKWEKNII